MYFPLEKYWYVKGGTIIHIMKDIDITKKRCGVIKVLMHIAQLIQDGIDYSGK